MRTVRLRGGIRRLNFPTLLTVFRLLLVPAFATLFLYGDHPWPLVTFAVAGATDALDGWLARSRGQMTRLGALLDPVADKALMLTAFGLLGLKAGVIPVWGLMVVLSREVCIVGGWVMRFFMTRSTVARPSGLGKVTTILQVVTVLALLAAPYVTARADALEFLVQLTMAVTALSGIDYVYRGLRELEPRRPRP